MGLETQLRPRARHVLVVAAPQDAQAGELVNALREAGLNVILANTELLASQANEVGVCILVLRPELWHETPAITAALQCNPSYMIPLLVEPMELPEGPWTSEPISLEEPIDETAQKLVAHITEYFRSLPEEVTLAVVPSLEEAITTESAPLTRPVASQSRPGSIKLRHSTVFILFLAVALTIALPMFFLSRSTADQTIYKNMKLTDSLLAHPYSAVVPGSFCDRGGARWAVGQYFKAPTAITTQGTPQTGFDASTEMTCKANGLLMTKKDHFNYYAIVVFEDRDSTALPRHFKTQIDATIISSSPQASIELGVRMQKADNKGDSYSSGYGNNTFTVREDGKWEVRRISNTSSAVEAILAHGSVSPAKTFTLSAEVNGPLMIFSVNGLPVSTVSDTTYQNSHGISFGVADPGATGPLSALFSHFTYSPLSR